MNMFRGVFIPSLEATFNVIRETIKAYLPEKSPCLELIRRGENEGGGMKMKDNTEMATMSEEGYEATGNIYQCIIIKITYSN